MLFFEGNMHYGDTALSTKAIAPTTAHAVQDEHEMSELHIICYLF